MTSFTLFLIFSVGNPPLQEREIGPYTPDLPRTKLSVLDTVKKNFYMLRAIPKFISFRPSVQDPWVIEVCSDKN